MTPEDARSKDVGDGSLLTLADAVVATLAALQVEAAHFVGHSLGAAVAARIAIDHPERVRSLVLIAPAGLGADGICASFLDGVVSAQRAKDLKAVLQMLPADPPLITREMVDGLLKAKRLDGVEEALASLRDRLVDGADAAALRRDLAAIPSALVITSDADRIVGAVRSEDLPAGFRLARVAGAGHLPHLEKAAEVNALLAEVLG